MKYMHTGNTDAQAFPPQSSLRYYGYTVVEMMGNPAQVSIHNGVGPLDPILSTISLAANESRNEWPIPGGVDAPNGIFIHVPAGDVQLAVYASNT